jgi:hypothetical protein
MCSRVMKTIQRYTKNLARRGYHVVKQAQDLPNPSLLHALITASPSLLRALLVSRQFASVVPPYFIDRVQTVSMLPRHEVSFMVLANLGKVCLLRLRLERKRLFAS